MSRCFPYPPPGYSGNVAASNAAASNDALILTIKPQRESNNLKSEKKKGRKSDKKERREDKVMRTLYGEKKVLPAADDKLYQSSKYAKYSNDYLQTKQQEASSDLMEKSSLTEEHGKPCCSSDSTENSGKRKRSPPPQTGNTTRNSGTVFRFVLNKRKKVECPTTSSDLAVSLPGVRVDSSSQKSFAAVTKSSVANPCMPAAKSNSTQELTITSSRVELPHPVKLTGHLLDQASTSTVEKKLPRPLRKFKELFEDWVPPSMELDTNDADEDWLFGGNKRDVIALSEKRIKSCAEEVPFYGKPALQPRAQYLSEVDLYALPYTIPF